MKHLTIIILTLFTAITVSAFNFTELIPGEKITALDFNNIFSNIKIEVDDSTLKIDQILALEIRQPIQETISFSGYLGKSPETFVRLKTIVVDEGQSLLSYDNSSFSKVIALQPTHIVVSASANRHNNTGGMDMYLIIYNSLDEERYRIRAFTDNEKNTHIGLTFSLDAGDYLAFWTGDPNEDSANTALSVTATGSALSTIGDLIP